MLKILILFLSLLIVFSCYPASYYDYWNKKSVESYLDSIDYYYLYLNYFPYYIYYPYDYWYPYVYLPFSFSLHYSYHKYHYDYPYRKYHRPYKRHEHKKSRR